MDERRSLIQRFRNIISVATLAYTFTSLHTIQYSMRHPAEATEESDDETSTGAHWQNPQSSTHDTLADTSAAAGNEKTSGRWTSDEINLLLDYVEANCVLTTARGLNLKKSQFTKARDTVKTKDASQCHYKWGHICVFVIRRGLADIPIAMCYLQGDLALGQKIR
jgi:hypothetical protein